MGERIFILLCATLAGTAWAIEDGAANEARAREDLAQKLARISRIESMREEKTPESAGGGKSFNANDGNPFTANTTYHKNVWDECQEWIGGQYCNKWLTAYVSKHGFGGDFSPLEQLVATEWKKRQGVDSGGNFEIWQIQRDGGGSNTDVDGKLERQGISSWNLLPSVARKVDGLGARYAETQLSLSYDENAAKGTMPNIETMRLMASRYTKIYRNNLMANLGELRANDKPIEFTLNEDMPNCDSYRKAMQTKMEETRIEERLQNQARLQPETRVAELKERYEMCVKVRAANYNLVNAQIKGNKVTAGDKEQEQYDKMAARINLALIDRGGLNPNSLPKPSNVAFKKSQYSNNIMDYNYGGSERGREMLSNADQIASYNNLLESAAVGLQGAASRAGGAITLSGDDITGNRIGIATRTLMDINGLTKEMKGELSNTSFARSTPMQSGGRSPASAPEQSPSTLTIKSAR